MNYIFFYQDSKGVEYATPNAEWALARAQHFGTKAYQQEINTSEK